MALGDITARWSEIEACKEGIFGLLTYTKLRPCRDLCRSYLNEKEEELVQHILCDCPALQGLRRQCLGRHSFKNAVPLMNLLKFVLVSLTRYSRIHTGLDSKEYKVSKWRVTN